MNFKHSFYVKDIGFWLSDILSKLSFISGSCIMLPLQCVMCEAIISRSECVWTRIKVCDVRMSEDEPVVLFELVIYINFQNLSVQCYLLKTFRE